MKNISSSLELYRIKYGYYRDPYNYFSVSDNGIVLWKQWTIGNDFYQIGTLTEKPVDPLLSVEYTYSVNADNSIYQIWGITESSAQY